MILKFFMYLKLSFFLTLLFAVLFGDVVFWWHENNMAEEFVLITILVFTILAVTKMIQLKAK